MKRLFAKKPKRHRPGGAGGPEGPEEPEEPEGPEGPEGPGAVVSIAETQRVMIDLMASESIEWHCAQT